MFYTCELYKQTKYFLQIVYIERFSIECRKPKKQINNFPIRLLSQSQTVVKPKPK